MQVTTLTEDAADVGKDLYPEEILCKHITERKWMPLPLRLPFRSRAAYWDGRNQLGESVASGVYFYTLTAGDFTATRKMLILK